MLLEIWIYQYSLHDFNQHKFINKYIQTLMHICSKQIKSLIDALFMPIFRIYNFAIVLVHRPIQLLK